MNTATALARSVLLQIVEYGISEVVLSPGSRNAPLSIALFQAEQAGLIRLHVRIDERTAAFFALGIAKATNKPVAILCTSGTAAANYHPAILEARHSGIPLLVLTADRPERLRNTGANQTTEQVGMFGGATPPTSDLWSSNEKLFGSLENLLYGPVHINLQFDEPLLPESSDDWLVGARKGEYLPPVNRGEEELILESNHGVIVVGHDRAGLSVPDVEKFISQIGWPVISEDPLSFPEAIPHAALFLSSTNLREELIAKEVIVIGRTTLSRSTNAFVKICEREIVIDPRIAGIDRNRTGDIRFSALPKVEKKFTEDPEWEKLWTRFSDQSARVVSEVPSWSEPGIARIIAEQLPKDTTLFISSSRPIRDIEAFADPRGGIETFANRGLAGIDGNISTALGIASQRSKTLAILGDLSFLHDLTALIDTEEINLRILVIDNDGGGIFSTLPQSGVAGFEKIFGTPHGKDLQQIANAFDLPSVVVTNIQDLLKEVFQPIAGLSIVIVKVPTREENAKLLNSIYRKL